MSVLEAKHLLKIYQMGNQKITALAGVDFVVEKGEFVAIMGPSGSGKSTLLHLLGGLDTPSQGGITLAGKMNHKPLWRAGITSVLFSNFLIYSPP